MTARALCIWTHDDDQPEGDNIWVTACGKECEFPLDGAPWRNGLRFCPYCGKPLDEQHLSAKAKEETT